ncbi:MAG: glycerol-3-phosphate acyltransferase [Anaerolineales bacterium]|nr:glycerol-3-phosphate acyltransferase [Anaerolineales bacterium]
MTTQGKTNWLLAGAVALLGYLLGSISWARIIAGRVKPEADISRIEEPVPNSEAVFVTDSVSATAVRVHVGTRYGCLTAVLDMLKVALPTLLLRRWQPDKPYHLISALAGAIGHDWPLYYRFKGGRGESVIYGALLVIDAPGVLATNAAGALLGLLAGNILILRWAGLVLMVPWLWWRTRSAAHVLYILGANVVYWYSMRPELQQYAELEGVGEAPTQEELAEFLGMGSGLGRVLDRYSIPGLLARWRS